MRARRREAWEGRSETAGGGQRVAPAARRDSYVPSFLFLQIRVERRLVMMQRPSISLLASSYSLQHLITSTITVHTCTTLRHIRLAIHDSVGALCGHPCSRADPINPCPSALAQFHPQQNHLCAHPPARFETAPRHQSGAFFAFCYYRWDDWAGMKESAVVTYKLDVILSRGPELPARDETL